MHHKLLKAPARRLLLAFVVTAGMTVATHAAPAGAATQMARGHRAAVAVRSREEQRTDYSKIEGIMRWGLNE